MDAITSIHNERVKQARALQNRRERRERGLLCIEGPRFIKEAVEAGAQVSACFYVEGSLTAADRQVLTQLQNTHTELLPVSEQVLASIADTTTPQGMIAVAKAPPQAGPGVLVSDRLVLVADQIRDPGNLGNILRTSAAVGAGMILLSGCTDPTGPKVVRSSAGACYAVPMWVGPSEAEVITELHKAGYRAVVLQMAGSQSLFAVELRGSVAVIIGNEGHGPSDAWSESGAELVHIPMPGKIESLNAGVAAAVVLYEALRQRTVGC